MTHSTIINELLQADSVLADLTEHNPNVLFELGMRIAENKPVVLVRATGTPRIFDVDHVLRIQEYSPNLWPSTVERDRPSLEAHITAGWENRDSIETYRNILHADDRRPGNPGPGGELNARALAHCPGQEFICPAPSGPSLMGGSDARYARPAA